MVALITARKSYKLYRHYEHLKATENTSELEKIHPVYLSNKN